MHACRKILSAVSCEKKIHVILSKLKDTLYTNLLYFLAVVVFSSSFYLHKRAFSLAMSLLMALQHLGRGGGVLRVILLYGLLDTGGKVFKI